MPLTDPPISARITGKVTPTIGSRSPAPIRSYDLLNKPSFLELVPGARSLTIEVGCGEGRVARELLALGHRVLGLRRVARAGPGRGVSPRGAARSPSPTSPQLPIATAAADVVVCFMVLMDIEDLDGAVAELARVLAPGGTLCVGILHPIMTSGLFVPGDEYRTFYMGEYLKPMRHVLDIERSDGGIFRFRLEHRPIERYFRAFEAAGLAVTALREPRPSDELAAERPEFANTLRVPNFLHLLARHVD